MDRLKEIKGQTTTNTMGDLHLKIEQNSKTGMGTFFSDVETLKSNITAIRDATHEIGEINQSVVLASSEDKEKEASSELNSIVEKTNKIANRSKKLLTLMKEDTERQKTSNSAQPSEIRIKENLLNTLTRKLVDVMKDYQACQTKYKNDIKKKVKRHIEIVKPDVTNEEIEAVFKADGASNVIKSAILKGEASESIKSTYQNVADKYQDVLTLEASVAELHQMFLDFAMLTEQQGELLDQIEHQVKQASDFIDEANQNLVESVELQKSIRYKQCCIVSFILIVLVVVIGGAVGSMAVKGQLGG